MNLVKCWNCGEEFEFDPIKITNKHLSAEIISDVLRSNMFDAQRGGTMIMNVDDMVDEVADIIAEYLHEA